MHIFGNRYSLYDSYHDATIGLRYVGPSSCRPEFSRLESLSCRPTEMYVASHKLSCDFFGQRLGLTFYRSAATTICDIQYDDMRRFLSAFKDRLQEPTLLV